MPRPDPGAARGKLTAARTEPSSALIERDGEVALVLTSLVAREHVLLVGPPGCAKSLLLEAVMRWLGGTTFTCLLTRFTTPEELFGPVSVAGLKEDRYRRITTGKLPEADGCFLDEVFKGSSAILNTLLRLLNERVLDPGDGVPVECPLRLCVAASNEWPGQQDNGAELQAVFDRFLLRKSVRRMALTSPQAARPRGRGGIGRRGFPGDDGVRPPPARSPPPMRHPHPGSFRRQATRLRHQFLQDGGSPFTDVLTDDALAGALATVGHWLDRISSPLATLWVFLGQVLSPDHSCRAAVARLVAHRLTHGQRPCSARTGAYCRARERLPEGFFSAVARRVGWNPDEQVDRRWLWRGRRVCLFDGSTVPMPDADENRREYPLAYNQTPGTSFAVARIGAIISLSCGAALDLGICRYAGKGQGEVGLLRRLWDALRPGDVLLGDRLMSGWVGMYLLKERGVDTVSRLSAHRRADFRKGTRLGKDDHLARWKKPTSIRSVDRRTYNTLPGAITVREVRFRVEQPGFRTRWIAVVTTPLDPERASKEELASLYRARRNNELDLRSIEVTLQVDVLRCKTPELVREEIWADVLAYNLIRTVMARAAACEDVPPRSVSFKATLQVLEAFRPLIDDQAHRGAGHRAAPYEQVLRAIAAHRVADRPDRFGPRMAKRRPEKYDRLTRPRREIKRQMLKRVRKM